MSPALLLTLLALFTPLITALRCPLIQTQRPYLPLDTALLRLDEDSWRQLDVTSTGRSLLGLMHSPRGERSAQDSGLCGVLCEASDAGSLVEDGLYVVRIQCFSRFRLKSPIDAFAPMPLFDVEPLVDARPEDDAAFNAADVVLTDRRSVLNSLEMRCHLCFDNVAQLLSWHGPGVAPSSRVATLSPPQRAELFHAVRRFAPITPERLIATPDECVIHDEDDEYEVMVENVEEDEMGAEAKAALPVGILQDDPKQKDWDVCTLERAFLHACAEPACVPKEEVAAEAEDAAIIGLVAATEEEDDAEEYMVVAGKAGERHAGELSDFGCSRSELYSFALTRLHDLSPEEVDALIAGRSTAARLAQAEAQLTSTRVWLGSKLGLGTLPTLLVDANGEPIQQQGGVAATTPAKKVRTGASGMTRMKMRWRRMLYRANERVERWTAAWATPLQNHGRFTNGWEAMEEGCF